MEPNKEIQNEQIVENNEVKTEEKNAIVDFFSNKKNLYIVAAAVAIVVVIVVAIVAFGGKNAPAGNDNQGSTSDVGGNNDQNDNTGNEGAGSNNSGNEGAGNTLAYNSTIELLNKAWDSIPDVVDGMDMKYSVDEESGEKFYYFVGGDMIVDEETWEPIVEYNQAGNVSLNADMLYNLYYPMDMIDNIDSAASLYSMMGNGIFTSAAFHVTSGSIIDIATKIEDGVQSEFWMCFMPQRVVLIEAPGDYIILVYGQDTVETFTNAVLSTIEGSKILIDNPISR